MIQVLLADSHQLLHPGIYNILSTTNEIRLIAVATCDNQLQKLCQKHQPNIILLALNIADIPWQNLLNDVRQHYSRAKILILLHHSHEVYLQQLIEFGIVGDILKSDPPERLIEAIQAIATGQVWFSPSLMTHLLQSSSNEKSITKFTKREVEVLQLIATEKTDKEIALNLGISESTVRYHLEQSNIKLGTTTRVGAVVEAIKRGIVK